MLCTIRKLRSVRIVFLFCVLASFSQTVQADDVSALSERLDALERENRLLKMDLAELRQERSPWHNVSETSAEPPDSSGDAKSNTDAAAAKKNTSSGDAKEGTKAPSV
ncbi:MAG: hypothetical protein ACK50J_18170, partial [Planctomyces sp.]